MPLANQDPNLSAVLAEIQQMLSELQFGAIEIAVHNGQVVQIERREKKRFGTATVNRSANTGAAR